jgi:hypothetical protein
MWDISEIVGDAIVVSEIVGVAIVVLVLVLILALDKDDESI